MSWTFGHFSNGQAWGHPLDKFPSAAFLPLHLQWRHVLYSRCCWADKSGVWKWASSPSPVWVVAPAPTLTPPTPGLMPTLLPALSPSLGWKLLIPFRGHSTWNCPWCQSGVSICPKTLQCHVPSREQGAGKNQPEQVFVSPECALPSFGLCWLSGPEQSVCPSGVPPVQVCCRL